MLCRESLLSIRETASAFAACPSSRKVDRRGSTWPICASWAPMLSTEWPRYTLTSLKLLCGSQNRQLFALSVLQRIKRWNATFSFVPHAVSRTSTKWSLTSSKTRPTASLLAAGLLCATRGWLRSSLRSAGTDTEWYVGQTLAWVTASCFRCSLHRKLGRTSFVTLTSSRGSASLWTMKLSSGMWPKSNRWLCFLLSWSWFVQCRKRLPKNRN